MVQYAMVGDGFVADTHELSDAEVRSRARLGRGGAVERYNRCPECGEWTTVAGRLRTDLDCPAVKKALETRHAL